MSIYNVAKFGNFGSELAPKGDVYGDSPRLEYSAEPFTATAISYTTSILDWKTAAGDYSEIRLVRSNDGYPETQEDGVIVWEWNTLSNLDKITTIVDGTDELYPLVSGRFVYYRIWLKIFDGSWIVAADATCLVPLRHATLAPDGTELVSTQNKLLDVLPRVYTTATQSPIDEVDPESPLANFLGAFAFELDRIQTYADLLLPLESGRLTSPEILMLQSLQLGLPIEPYLATKQQRRLAREALYIYQNKGTRKAIEDFVESLTGFAPTVTPSPNLIVTAQDSSFTNGVGFWRPVGDCVLSVENSVPGVPPTIEPFVADYRYTAKVVVNEIDSKIVSGTDKPKTQATPVVSGTPYTFSGYGKSASGDMGVYAYAIWYGYEGEIVRIDPPKIFPVVEQIIPDNEWTRYESVTRAPGVKQSLISASVTSGIATIDVSPYNVMFISNTILISGVVTGNAEFDDAINTYHQIIDAGLPTELDPTPKSWLKIALDVADFETTRISGILQEAYPTLAGPPTLDNPTGESSAYYSVVTDPNATALSAAASWTGTYYGLAGGVVTGSNVGPYYLDSVGTVVMDSIDGLTVGDNLLIQGIDAIFSYGHHVIINIDTGTNAVSFALPGHPTGTIPVPGFAMKVVPNSGFVAPEAHYAGFELVFKDTGTIYLDLLQMATYDVQEYHEARSAEIFLDPQKSNFLKNPGFNPATLSATWDIAAAGGTTVDRTIAPLSLIGPGYALEVETFDTATTFTPTVISSTTGAVSTGKYITASVYARTELADTAEAMNLSATAYDVSTGSPVAVASANTDIIITNKLTRYHVTMFVPGNSSFKTSTVGVNMVLAGATTGNTIYLDHAEVENSFYPTDYIDGDLNPSYGAVWQGAEHNSASHLYPGLPIKITRLQQELHKYLPMNISFLIRWYDGSQPYGGVAKPIL